MSQVHLGEYRQEAASLIASGQYAAARRVAQHMLHHYPDYIQGHHLLAQSLLGAGHLLDAAAQFSWVLSCDPESASARLGLARVHRTLGNTRLAQTHLARAFDLFPGDPELRDELNALMASDAQMVTQPHEMTRAALGRIYARNGLCDKAIQEFDAVLQQEPDRYDVLAALAEMLWRDDHAAEAVSVCHRILEALPKALKANLIVAAAWLTSPQPEEAQPYLTVAQALDPEHIQSELLFGPYSPLPRPTPMIERLAEPSLSASSVLGDRPPEKSMASVDRKTDFDGEETTSMSDQPRPEEDFEIPDWLQGVGDELLAEDGAPSQPASISASADATPDWLRALVSRAEATPTEDAGDADAERWQPHGTPVGDAAEAPQSAELPEWLQRIAAGEASTEAEPMAPTTETTDAETADWLSQLSAMHTEAAAALDERPLGDRPGAGRLPDLEIPDVEIDETDLPDWLRETPAVATTDETATPGVGLPDWLRAEEPAPLQERATASTSDLPDWLKAIAAGTPAAVAASEPPSGPSDVAAPESPQAKAADELPDWLREPGLDLAAAPTEVAQPSSAAELTADLPDWLRPLADVETSATSQSKTEEPELAAWLTEDIASAVPAGDAADYTVAEPLDAEAAVPDWLRELQEPRPQPAPGPVADADLEPGAVTATADDTGLPEWLRRLRAGVAEEAPALGTRDLEADLAALSIVGVEDSKAAEDQVAPPAGVPEAAEDVFEPHLPPPTQEPVSLTEVEEPALREAGLPPTEELAAAVESAAEQPVPPFALEETPPVETVAPAAAIETAPPPVEEPVVPLQPVPTSAPEVSLPPLEDLPRDAAERLALARAAADTSWSQALSVYESLVSSADLLSTVIADLEEGIRKHPDDYAGYQLVGDAYMKEGRLPEALRAYRTALTKLQQR
jgi:tetratricopeptide (TPR) repeat protein